MKDQQTDMKAHGLFTFQKRQGNGYITLPLYTLVVQHPRIPPLAQGRALPE